MEERPSDRHYDYNVPITVRVPRLAVHELIQIPANAYPDKAALNFFGTEITFLELRGLVMRFANALGSLGVQKGERVGIHLPTCPQYPIGYYAALSLGAIVVNLKPIYTAEELKLMATNSGAAPMPVEMIEQVRDMGIFFGEGYGLTESSALGISNPILGMKKVGSIGIPFIDNDVRLVSVKDGVTDVKQGEPGEIIMKGPLIMKGY